MEKHHASYHMGVVCCSQEFAGAKRQFVHRSWEHIKHARSQRAVHKLRSDNQELTDFYHEAMMNKSLLSAKFPFVRNLPALPDIQSGTAGCNSMVSGDVKSRLATAHIEIALHLARLPSSKTSGRSSQVCTQHAAACVSIADAIADIQRGAAGKKLFEAPIDGTTFRVASFASQWDETLQRMRSPVIAASGQVQTGQLRIQVMVQAPHEQSI